jgi:ERCC4-type nuclease
MTAPEARTILVDSREQRPWFSTQLAAGTAQRATLPTADYTIAGLEHLVLIERKSLQDLVAVVGYGRDRFERELARMSGECRFPHLVIEATPAQVELRSYRGRIAPAAVLGSLAAWSFDFGLRIHWGGAPDACERWALRLFAAVERRVARGELDPSPRSPDAPPAVRPRSSAAAGGRHFSVVNPR